MGQIKLIIYEDNESYRNTLSMICKTEKDIAVVDEFPDCNYCVEEVGKLNPDLVLMDIRMPGGPDGLESLLKIKKAYPEIAVIMLTDCEVSTVMYESYISKANGYFVKSKVTPKELINGIRAVINENKFVANGEVLDQVLYFGQNGAPQNAKKFRLTGKELEVLALICNGLTESEIALNLGKSKETVHKQKQSIYEKLGVNRETEAVSFAYQHRLLPSEELRFK